MAVIYGYQINNEWLAITPASKHWEMVPILEDILEGSDWKKVLTRSEFPQ